MVLSGIINGLKVVGKEKENCKVIVNGAGSAGIAITKLLLRYGFKDVTLCDKSGILSKSSQESELDAERNDGSYQSGRKRQVLWQMLLWVQIFLSAFPLRESYPKKWLLL